MTLLRNPLELLAELRQALWAASPNVVQQVRPALSDLLRQIDRQHGARLAAGQYVEFRGHGVLLGAEIERVNIKTVSVVVRTPPSYEGQRWKVSPSLVTPVARPANLPAVMSLGKEQAVALAKRALGDETDMDDMDATHLAERDGQHLVFVETSAHGYYLVVKKGARARIVGEEDCGIADRAVRAFFDIDIYASRCFEEQGKPLL